MNLVLLALIGLASLVCFAAAAVIIAQSGRGEISWRTATGFALGCISYVLLQGAITLPSDALPVLAILGLFFCVPVARVLVPRVQRVACLNMLAPPERRLGRSRVFRAADIGAWLMVAAGLGLGVASTPAHSAPTHCRSTA